MLRNIHFSNDIVRFVFLLGFYLALVLVFLQSCIVLPNDAFDLEGLGQIELRYCGRGRDITAPNLRVFFATPILVFYLRVGLLRRGH